jgi:hypothetical protein
MERHCVTPRLGDRTVVTASVLVRGTSGRRPVSGRVWVGVDQTNRSLRVQSDAPTEFILTAENALLTDDAVSDGFATLYLPGQQQIVQQASSRELLAVVLGIPLPVHEFLRAFNGCRLAGGDVQTRTLGPNSRRVSIGNTTDLVLRRTDSRSPWTLFATSGQSQGRAFGWRAEYERELDVMQSVRIVSEEANGVRGRLFDLEFSLSQIQIAPLIMSETFSPTVPPETRSVSLQTLTRQRALPMVNAAR